MIYFSLIIEFFKIGLFSFGGGYATIPFLYHISNTYGWYTVNELRHMIAVASVTPGPVGINVATYAGLKSAGLLGAMCATIFEMLPSFILVIITSKILKKFNDNFYVKATLSTLRPISCALLASVAIGLFKPILGDIKAIILLAILLILSWKSKKDPLFYMLIGGVVGVIMRIFF
ncbi:MAG: chromate transporter [bacterium]|nr:chromate transporter [bacterium]